MSGVKVSGKLKQRATSGVRLRLTHTGKVEADIGYREPEKAAKPTIDALDADLDAWMAAAPGVAAGAAAGTADMAE